MNVWRRPHYVYALLDALDIEVYIGMTHSPTTRLRTHNTSPCGRPMRDAVEHGCRFRMRILSEHPSAHEAHKEETRLIELRRPLLNVAGNYHNHRGLRGHKSSPTKQWWHERQREANTVISWR